jgi:hypothetical protein
MSVGAFAPGRGMVAPVTPSTHPPMRGFRDYGPISTAFRLDPPRTRNGALGTSRPTLYHDPKELSKH